jgi:hypothetical protein
MEKLKIVFNRRQKVLPPFGAMNEQISVADKTAQRKGYRLIYLFLVLFLTSLFLFKEGFYSTLIISYLIVFAVLSVMQFNVTADSSEIHELLSECKDLEMLNKVKIAAKSSVAVEQQLKLLANSDRDYLCWYEVFTLLAIAEEDFQNSALQEAKSQIAQMVNQSTELVRATDLVRPFELK